MSRQFPYVLALCGCALLAAADPGGGLAVFHPNREPTRIARGIDGQVAVSDPSQNSVFIYDGGLNLLGELKQLGTPLGVAVDGDGRIYVGNDDRDNVEVYDRSGNLIRSVGGGVLKKPSDLALDLAGNLYVADSEQDRVSVFDAAGTLLRHIGATGTGNGRFMFPVSLDIAYPAGAAGGELVVADQGNGRVQVFDLAGTFLRKFGTKPTEFTTTWTNYFNSIQSVSVDDLGRIHALDAYLNKVQVFSPEGVFAEAYGEFGTDPGRINLALDIVCAGDGRVLGANSGNGRVEPFFTVPATRVVLSADTVAESAPPGTIVGTLSADPPPPGGCTFALVTPAGRAGDAFVLEGNVLKTAAPLDFEASGGAYHLQAKARWNGSVNLAYGTPLTVRVVDGNNAPTGVTLDHHAVYENQPPGTRVGRLSALDPDAGDSVFTFALVDGPGGENNGLFSIQGDELLTAAPLDFETIADLSVLVRVADAAGASATSEVAVVVTDIGEVGDLDTDGDGIPDWFERDVCGSTTNLAAAADNDGDQVSNLDEWVAATDPRRAGSLLALNGAETPPSDVVLYWESPPEAEGRLYDVEFATDLMSPVWHPLAIGIPAQPGMNVFTNHVHDAESRVYYRIRARLNP
ncbi:MAG: cadherin domain-containing protein [Kiritimatiellia bacterium]